MNKIKRARQVFYNKKTNPAFKYFSDRGIDYFVNWYLSLDRRCCYCGIEEYKLAELFLSGRLSTKRSRGRSLELERFDSSNNHYTEENCALACYFCNNHKSDIITCDEHIKYFSYPIRQFINDLYGQDEKVIDSQTNFLYLSDRLKLDYPVFYSNFIKVLTDEDIRFDFLNGTEDVWAVDYMPIQITKDQFIQFTYNPDYLREYNTWSNTITDTATVCKSININPKMSDILIDGGNIIRSKTKVIMTSKIFKENHNYSTNNLIKEIENLLKLELIIIPLEPHDWIGHADGIVRFLNERTVLINDYSDENHLYYIELKMSLRNAGLDIIEIPFDKPKGDQANGLYINYLQMEKKIFLPVFGIEKDKLAINAFENLFREEKIIPVQSNDIGKDGGLLNCITWNIKKDL